MPYHSQAVERPWEEVDHGMQILLIVFMRAVAGGFMAVALAIILLQRQFDKTKLDWIPGIIFIVGFVSVCLFSDAAYPDRAPFGGLVPAELKASCLVAT